MDAKDRIIEQRMAKRRQNALILRSIIAFLILVIVGFLVLTVAVIKLIGVLAARRSAKRSAQNVAQEAESEVPEQERKPEA